MNPADPGSGGEEAGWFIPALEAIARGERENLSSFLHTIGDADVLADTRTSVRTHWLVSDGNGRPRVQALADRLAEEVVHYCVPRSKIAAAMDHYARTGSLNKISRLQTEARALFSKLAMSGEGGELLLYFLMESYLGIPQILSKMSMKTNANVHFHGVDGVHAQMLDDGKLAVYWGESKVYNDFGSAIGACFNSIEPFLNDAGGGPLERDIHLVRDNIDAGDRELTLALARYFDSDTPDASRLEVRGACLIGFSHEDYTSPFAEDGESLSEAFLAVLSDWQTRIRVRITGKRIDSFHIEVFCLPIPSADDFRSSMQKALGLT